MLHSVDEVLVNDRHARLGTLYKSVNRATAFAIALSLAVATGLPHELLDATTGNRSRHFGQPAPAETREPQMRFP
jgi:hypothetical protein